MFLFPSAGELAAGQSESPPTGDPGTHPHLSKVHLGAETRSQRAPVHALTHSQATIPLTDFRPAPPHAQAKRSAPRTCAPVCTAEPEAEEASWGSCDGAPRSVVIATWTPRHAECQPGTPGTSRNSAQNGPRSNRMADGTEGRSGHQPSTPFSVSTCLPRRPRPSPRSPLWEGHRRPAHRPAAWSTSGALAQDGGSKGARRQPESQGWGRSHPHSCSRPRDF